MTYYQYYIINKPGFTIEEACEEASTRTSRIAEYRAGTPTGMFFECTASNKARFNPSFPDDFYARKQMVIKREGVTTIEKPLFEEKLANNANPFFQLILINVSKSDSGMKEEDIIRHLIYKNRVFPNTKESILKIKGLIGLMSSSSFLLKRGDNLIPGIPMIGGDNMIDWREGYDPVADQIMGFIKGVGVTACDEIYKYITEYLGWIKNNDVVDSYLKDLVGNGYLSVQYDNWYQWKKHLEPFVNKDYGLMEADVSVKASKRFKLFSLLSKLRKKPGIDKT